MPSERVQARIDQLLSEAEAAADAYNWESVRRKCEAVLDLDPDNAAAVEYLEAMKRFQLRTHGRVTHDFPPPPAAPPSSPVGVPARPEAASRPWYTRFGCVIVGGLMGLLVALAITGAFVGNEDASTSDPAAPDSGGDGKPSPQGTAAPTPAPFQTITLTGNGQTATEAITLPAAHFVAAWTHTGGSNFAVWAHHRAGRDLLINEIGPYAGSRPLVGPGQFVFDITADGAWSVTINPIGFQDSISTTGRGDTVSGWFSVDGDTAIQFGHNGSSNFAVWLTCDGGRDLFQNEIGPVAGSRIANIPRGSEACYWDVVADGEWGLVAR
jgi:hypothetical protein